MTTPTLTDAELEAMEQSLWNDDEVGHRLIANLRQARTERDAARRERDEIIEAAAKMNLRLIRPEPTQ